ncbi:hypothetical protein VR479_00745 [Aquirufa aurantiipilula]
MESIEDYRIKLKEIADYAFGYGIRAIGIEQFKVGPPDTWDESIKNIFFIACHDGFKIAQGLLVVEIKKYQSLLRETTNQLKEFRRQRDKENEKIADLKIKIIEQRLHNFSHIADGIAWQLIGGQIHIARRFHIQEMSTKYLDSSNIEHAIQTAEEINKNPNDFALISDLTSFVQIGDLLVRHDKIIGIMELKEGKVNYQIKEFLDNLENVGRTVSDDELKIFFDGKTIKQLKRMQRQQERAVRATDVINNDKGIDPVSGGKIVVSTPKVFTEYYHEDLSNLQEDLKEKIWAYTCLETCLHIGMYRDKGITMAGFAIKELLKNKTANYIIIDWLSITHNLSEPLFGKPFSPDFIIDVLIGKIKIIIGLDLDALIDTFNVFGLKARWLTEKETTKSKQGAIRDGMVIVNKRGIAVTLPDKKEMIILGGTLSKILYDSIKPTSIATSMLNLASPDDPENDEQEVTEKSTDN